MRQLEADPIKAEYFYENDDEKIKLNWFCYEYAFFLYNEIRESIKLTKFKKQKNQEQIVKFCVYFSKEMKKSIFERLGKLTNATVIYEKYVESYFPENNKAINMFILEVAARAWDTLLAGCEICPTQCISKMYEKCTLFDMLDENGGMPGA
jgi:effector-binding domain-containing protein